MIVAFGMPSIGTLVFIAVIVLVLFGSRRLRGAGKNTGIPMRTLVPFWTR